MVAVVDNDKIFIEWVERERMIKITFRTQADKRNRYIFTSWRPGEEIY